MTEETSVAAGHPQWPNWQCQFRSFSAGAEVREQTVGDKFIMACEGPAVEFDQDEVRIFFPKEEQAYSLNILEVKKLSSNEAEFVVTAYKPGNHQPEWIELGGGEAGFRTAGLQWQVKSIVPPDAKAEPFNDVKLMGLAYPAWMWGLLVALVVTLLLGFFIRIRQRAKIRSLVAEVDERGSATDYLSSFHKDLRHLVREFDYQTSEEEEVFQGYLRGLDKSLKIYFTRVFKLPFLHWGATRLSRLVRRSHRGAYKDVAPKIKNLLIELKTSLESKKLSSADVQQFKKVATEVVDKVYLVAKQKEKKA